MFPMLCVLDKVHTSNFPLQLHGYAMQPIMALQMQSLKFAWFYFLIRAAVSWLWICTFHSPHLLWIMNFKPNLLVLTVLIGLWMKVCHLQLFWLLFSGDRVKYVGASVVVEADHRYCWNDTVLFWFYESLICRNPIRCISLDLISHVIFASHLFGTPFVKQSWSHKWLLHTQVL